MFTDFALVETRCAVIEFYFVPWLELCFRISIIERRIWEQLCSQLFDSLVGGLRHVSLYQVEESFGTLLIICLVSEHHHVGLVDQPCHRLHFGTLTVQVLLHRVNVHFLPALRRTIQTKGTALFLRMCLTILVRKMPLADGARKLALLQQDFEQSVEKVLLEMFAAVGTLSIVALQSADALFAEQRIAKFARHGFLYHAEANLAGQECLQLAHSRLRIQLPVPQILLCHFTFGQGQVK